jgi:hypothetical protein
MSGGIPQMTSQIGGHGDSNFFPPRVEPPEPGQIRELYEQLWGTIGADCVLPSKGNASNEVGVLEIVAPTRKEEGILKLGRMKSGVAAGPDGMTKAHLRQAGAVTVLTRIMNACLLKNYYPKMWRENRTVLIPKARKDASNVLNYWFPLDSHTFWYIR